MHAAGAGAKRGSVSELLLAGWESGAGFKSHSEIVPIKQTLEEAPIENSCIYVYIFLSLNLFQDRQRPTAIHIREITREQCETTSFP